MSLVAFGMDISLVVLEFDSIQDFVHSTFVESIVSGSVAICTLHLFLADFIMYTINMHDIKRSKFLCNSV